MDANRLTFILTVSFFVLFSGIGILLIFLYRRSKKKALKSMSWPETKGTIIRSEVAVGDSVFGGEDDGGGSQPMYSAEISYTYRVGNMLYTSDRISFAVKSSHSKPDKAKAVTERYPEGSEVIVFYSPDQHDLAVLERSAKGSGALNVAGIVFLCIGVISLIVGLIILM